MLEVPAVDGSQTTRPLTARDLIAAALAVWGISMLGEIAAYLIGAYLPFALSRGGFAETWESLLMFAPSAALALILVLSCKRLARVLTAADAGAASPFDMRQVQRVGIQVIGISFMAAAVTALQFVDRPRSMAGRDATAWSFLWANVGCLVKCAIGLALILTAPRIDAWIATDRRSHRSDR